MIFYTVLSLIQFFLNAALGLFKYTQMEISGLILLKTSFNHAWSGSTIVPTANSMV